MTDVSRSTTNPSNANVNRRTADNLTPRAVQTLLHHPMNLRYKNPDLIFKRPFLFRERVGG